MGELLLAGVMGKAREMQAAGRLASRFLPANRKSEAAIHLCEKPDFRHGAAIRARHGKRHARCDVATAFPL